MPQTFFCVEELKGKMLTVRLSLLIDLRLFQKIMGEYNRFNFGDVYALFPYNFRNLFMRGTVDSLCFHDICDYSLHTNTYCGQSCLHPFSLSFLFSSTIRNKGFRILCHKEMLNFFFFFSHNFLFKTGTMMLVLPEQQPIQS